MWGKWKLIEDVETLGKVEKEGFQLIWKYMKEGYGVEMSKRMDEIGRLEGMWRMDKKNRCLFQC